MQEDNTRRYEHAFQAAKAKFPKDAKKIKEADSPGQAKRLGRKCVMRDDWEQIKFQVMLDCLRLKFKISELRNMLGKLLMQVRSELLENK